mmetsp:Transcript_16635/g.39302  ORF Transcript_16635/g.39302 Transcript_16635/m.39302 type:complete len:83 (+) Transcript_16635:1336-1584(+)
MTSSWLNSIVLVPGELVPNAINAQFSADEILSSSVVDGLAAGVKGAGAKGAGAKGAGADGVYGDELGALGVLMGNDGERGDK